MIDKFHLRCLAAAGDKDADNILKGLDLVGWGNIDLAAPWSRIETDFLTEHPDTTREMERFRWHVMRSTMRSGEVYYLYHMPERLVT